MRTVGIWQTNITDLVAEGTMVKEGDYVATLDKTELTNRMRDAQTQMDKMLTQLEQAKIDTAIELRGIRDQIVNLQFQKKKNNCNSNRAGLNPKASSTRLSWIWNAPSGTTSNWWNDSPSPKRNLRQKSPK